MGKKNVHVVPNGDKWSVKVEGVKTPVSNHRTQGAAITSGETVARRNESELRIHRKDGTIRDSDSYGRDPNPPKDKKH